MAERPVRRRDKADNNAVRHRTVHRLAPDARMIHHGPDVERPLLRPDIRLQPHPSATDCAFSLDNREESIYDFVSQPRRTPTPVGWRGASGGSPRNSAAI